MVLRLDGLRLIAGVDGVVDAEVVARRRPGLNRGNAERRRRQDSTKEYPVHGKTSLVWLERR